jgi:phosphate starvation-inducible PhoH-like protein
VEQEKRNIEISNKIIGNVFGRLDDNMRKIEKAFSVNIVNRGDHMTIVGQNSSVNQAQRVIEKLMRIAESGEEITEQSVNYLIALNADEGFEEIEKINKDYICMTVTGRPIKPKTLGQKKYVDLIRKNNVVFGVGPAGTGKTYLAMAMAITAFKNNEVSRIILTRPAIEAGEKLGFLPGDLQQKVDPYLRPLYDALHEIMGTETFQKNLEKGAIEVAPLAYMRGRTLDNAYIVLDEAQNTTPEQMKMFLTRIGFGSKAIITGDLTQIDLPDGKKSGIVEAIKILTDIEGIGISHLTNKDVVRHPLVQKIIEAYEKHEEKAKKREALEMKKATTYKKIGRGMRSRRE